jgi:hypothetical protein
MNVFFDFISYMKYYRGVTSATLSFHVTLAARVLQYLCDKEGGLPASALRDKIEHLRLLHEAIGQDKKRSAGSFIKPLLPEIDMDRLIAYDYAMAVETVRMANEEVEMEGELSFATASYVQQVIIHY